MPAVCLAITHLPAAAAETWSWNTASFSLLKTNRWQASLLTTGRTGHGLSTARQVRVGGIAKLHWSPRFTAMGGYYYYRDRDDLYRWNSTQRLFGGFESPIFGHGRTLVEARTLAERYLPGYKPDFTRLRQRFTYSTSRRVGPYAAVEGFFITSGLDFMRYAAGVRWHATAQSAFELGYLYDQRRPAAGPPRHVIETHFYFGHWERKR